jgi:hypothetical protein
MKFMKGFFFARYCTCEATRNIATNKYQIMQKNTIFD